MFGLLHPWWLLALVAVPVIRSLHRHQAPLSSFEVSAVFLWPEDASDDAPGRELRPPDPAWRRRAFIAALLIAALTGPVLERERGVLTVWIDESLSMQTIEDGESRRTAALRNLDRELQGHDYTSIVRHTLTEPLPTQIDDSSVHWLVTDAAGENVRDWAARVQIDRVIPIGQRTENVSVTRLAARRSLDGDEFDVLVSVSNTGNDAAVRRVELRNDVGPIQETNVALDAGQTAYWRTRIPGSDSAITAVLNDSDALTADDTLTIAAGTLQRLATSIDPRCGSELRSALAAHPGLAVVDANATAHMAVSCPAGTFPDHENEPGPVSRIVAGPASRIVAGPSRIVAGPASRIRVLGGNAGPVASPPLWLPAAGTAASLILPTDLISSSAWPGPIDAGRQRVWLRSGNAPLIAVTEFGSGVRVVDTVIDLRHPGFVRQPEFAALVAVLVDAAAGRAVLDAATVESREVAASVIRPGEIDIGPIRSPAIRSKAQVPLFTFFVIAAMLALAFDMALLGRARRTAAHA